MELFGASLAVIPGLKFLGDAMQPMASLDVANTGHIAEITNMSLKLLAAAALFVSPDPDRSDVME